MFGFEKVMNIICNYFDFLRTPSDRQGYLVGEQDDYGISSLPRAASLLPGLSNLVSTH